MSGSLLLLGKSVLIPASLVAWHHPWPVPLGPSPVALDLNRGWLYTVKGYLVNWGWRWYTPRGKDRRISEFKVNTSQPCWEQPGQTGTPYLLWGAFSFEKEQS